jgi:hypothetical protein
VERITAKTDRVRLERNYFESLNSARFDFAREYIRALNLSNVRPGDKLNIFEGVARLAEAEVIPHDLLHQGLMALQAWWQDVERRPIVDLAACSLLRRQLARLERIQKRLQSYAKPNSESLLEVSKVRHDLEHRGGVLSSRA